MVENLKNIKIADPEQSKLFKNALNNYIKVDKEQNTKLQDALQKEGIIKGDGFIMNKPNPKDAKSDYTRKFNVEKWINDVSGILKDEWVVNLKTMAKKHPEMFKSEADVYRVIKEIKDNPTHFFKNYDNEVALIAKPLKNGKTGNIGVVKKTGDIIHANQSRAKDLDRLSRRNKEMVAGTPAPATAINNVNADGGLLNTISGLNLIKDKPKESLKEKLDNFNQKNQEKKAKTQKAIDEIHEKVKPKDKDILKRFDDYLGENKKLNLEYLENMDLNPANYNLTREFIINAKNNIDKDIKTDIPDTMRKNIEQKLNIKPLKEFGINYAEYYHDGTRAIKKLMQEKQGQVAGAFHRKDLGDIDLVWGEVSDKEKHKGYGLAHIIDKHPDLDLNLMDEIVKNGKVIRRENRKQSFNIVFKDYILGINKGFNKSGENQWIVTAFEKK